MLLVKHSRSIIVSLDSNLLKGKAKLYKKLEIKMRKIESEKKRERERKGEKEKVDIHCCLSRLGRPVNRWIRTRDPIAEVAEPRT